MKYQKILEQYAAKASGMTLEEALHHITEMYMDQCGVSISLRTVVYEADEMLSSSCWKILNGSRKSAMMIIFSWP